VKQQLLKHSTQHGQLYIVLFPHNQVIYGLWAAKIDPRFGQSLQLGSNNLWESRTCHLNSYIIEGRSFSPPALVAIDYSTTEHNECPVALKSLPHGTMVEKLVCFLKIFNVSVIIFGHKGIKKVLQKFKKLHEEKKRLLYMPIFFYNKCNIL